MKNEFTLNCCKDENKERKESPGMTQFLTDVT